MDKNSAVGIGGSLLAWLSANIGAFFTAHMTDKNGKSDAGRAINKLIYDAADVAAVNAVVDNR